MEMSFKAISGVEKMPRTAWEVALESAEGKQSGTAMDEELARLREMGTWELMEDMPEGRVPIGNQWVFTKKKDEHGNTIWYMARLVAQGFSQNLELTTAITAHLHQSCGSRAYAQRLEWRRSMDGTCARWMSKPRT